MLKNCPQDWGQFYLGILKLCPGFKVKGLLRLFKLAKVPQLILNFWLMLNSVSPFWTLYSINLSWFGWSALLISVEPKTCGWLGLKPFMELLFCWFRTMRNALAAKPTARVKQTMALNFNSAFLE